MLVTVAELRDYMDISLTTAQTNAAEMVLEGLQNELETYLGRPIEKRFFVEQHQTGVYPSGLPSGSFFYSLDDPTASVSTVDLIRPNWVVYLERTPIHQITEVTIVSATPGSTPTTLVAGTDYIELPFGIEVFSVFPYDIITVTYEAGLDGLEIPAFRLFILRAATREMQNMHDDTVGVKDLTTRNVAPLETGYLEKELKALKRWRRNRIS